MVGAIFTAVGLRIAYIYFCEGDVIQKINGFNHVNCKLIVNQVIEKCLDQQLPCLINFIDFKAAFDSAHRP